MHTQTRRLTLHTARRLAAAALHLFIVKLVCVACRCPHTYRHGLAAGAAVAASRHSTIPEHTTVSCHRTDSNIHTQKTHATNIHTQEASRVHATMRASTNQSGMLCTSIPVQPAPCLLLVHGQSQHPSHMTRAGLNTHHTCSRPAWWHYSCAPWQHGRDDVQTSGRQGAGTQQCLQDKRTCCCMDRHTSCLKNTLSQVSQPALQHHMPPRHRQQHGVGMNSIRSTHACKAHCP